MIERFALALALALLGCRSDAEQPSVEAPAPVTRAFEPLAPAPGRFVATNGLISVPVPEGQIRPGGGREGREDQGWECLEEQHGDADAAAVSLRCRRKDPRELLFFSAKTHRQPPDQRTDAETVLMSLYRADNEAFFARVEYTSSRAATLAGASGWEAELIAEHPQLGSIRKRERLSIVGDRVFAISAEGTPALWDAHAAQIDAWFAGVEFAIDSSRSAGAPASRSPLWAVDR